MLYEEEAGLKSTRGKFINSITPALYSISAAAERRGRGVAAKPSLLSGPHDKHSPTAESSEGGEPDGEPVDGQDETSRAPTDDVASVKLSDIQRLTQAFASSAVGSAAKRRQYQSTAIDGGPAPLIMGVSVGSIPQASVAILGNASSSVCPSRDRGGTGNSGQERGARTSESSGQVATDVGNGPASQGADDEARHDPEDTSEVARVEEVVQTESKDGRTGWQHLHAVKRLNAMLSQLDSKDRDALKLRASQL